MRKWNLTIRKFFTYALIASLSIFTPKFVTADSYLPSLNSLFPNGLSSVFSDKVSGTFNQVVNTTSEALKQIGKNTSEVKSLAQDVLISTKSTLIEAGKTSIASTRSITAATNSLNSAINENVSRQVATQSASVTSALNAGLEKVFGFAIDKTATVLTPFFIKKENTPSSIVVNNSNTSASTSTQSTSLVSPISPTLQTQTPVQAAASAVVLPTFKKTQVTTSSQNKNVISVNLSTSPLIQNILARLNQLENMPKSGTTTQNFIQNVYNTYAGGGSYTVPSDTSRSTTESINAALAPINQQIALLSNISSGSYSNIFASIVATSSATSTFAGPITSDNTITATAFYGDGSHLTGITAVASFATSTVRGVFSNTATGLTYDNTTGITSLTSGYNIPLTASTTEWANKVGSQWTTSGGSVSYSGNVGIGTASPEALLHIKHGTDQAKILVETSGGGYTARVTAKNAYGLVNEMGIFGDSTYGAIGAREAYQYSTAPLTIMSDAVSGIIKFATGGTSERMRIDSNGNVGIGTTTPSAKLAITGSGTGTGQAFVVADSANAQKFTVLDNGQVNFAGGSLTNDGILTVNNPSNNSAFVSQRGGSEYGRISTNNNQWSFNIGAGQTWALKDALASTKYLQLIEGVGNLGIGTVNNTIGARVHAISTTEQLRLGYDGTNYLSTTIGSAGGVTWNAAGTLPNFNFTGGNVGIGTSTPGSKLTVAGNIFSTGNIQSLTASTSVLTIGPFASSPIITTTGASGSETFTVNNNTNDWAYDFKAGATSLLRIHSNGYTTLGGSIFSGGTAQFSGALTMINNNASTQYHNLWDDSNNINSQSGFASYGYNGSARVNTSRMTFGKSGTWGVGTEDGYISFDTAQSGSLSEVMRIGANRNVGIGTTTPGYALTVAGDINFTGALRANGDTGTTGMVLLSNGTGASPTWVATSSLGISGGGGSLTGTTGQFAFFSGTDTAVGTSTLFLSNGNIGIGTTTPAAALSVVGAGNFTSDLTTRGILNVLGTGTSTITSDILLSGDIVPSADNTYRLGTPSRMWKDVYIGPGSLYVNGQKVLQTDVSNNVTITADSNQNLVLKSAGTGDLELNPSGTGQILLKGNLRLSAGKTITTSDASPVVLSNGADLGFLRVASNTITPTNLNGGITIAATGTGGVYFTQGNVGIATTSPSFPLTVSGDINFTGALRANGDAGTTGMVLLSNGSSAPTWVATSSLGIGSSQWTTSGSDISFATGYVGIGTTTPSARLFITGSAGTTDLFNIASSTNASLFKIGATGATYFNNDAGTTGMVLLSNGISSSPTWVATSSLGISGGGSLTGTTGQFAFFSGTNTAVGTSTLFLSNGNIGIGTTTPAAALTVAGGGLATENIVLGYSNANIINPSVGFSGYTNFTGGIGTGGRDSVTPTSRLTSLGNLVNIGSIQAGELSLTNAGTFAAKVDYTTGTSPYTVAIGDLNGDGKADLAAVNTSTSKLSIFINNGSGVFAAKVDYIVGTSAQGVAIGDVNGDGKADVAVTNGGSANVSVLMNNGNGTFAAKVDYTTGTSPYPVVLADVNGDGKSDLIVGNSGANTVSVLMNYGNGTFGSKTDYAVGSAPSLAVGDFNGDGKTDIVTTGFSFTASVLMNNGNGTFATKVDYSTGAYPASVTVGDITGDGKDDFVTGYQGGVSVYRNNGTGTFATHVDYSYTNGVGEFVSLGDLNGDGKLDVVSSNYDNSNMSVLLNTGSGVLGTRTNYTTGANPRFSAIGDLNGDGKADIVTANAGGSSVSVFLNTTTSSLFVSGSTGFSGVGTTTPSQKLSVAGNLQLTGAIFDSSNASGTVGMVLQSTGEGTQWVATSSLGISGGGSLSGGTNGYLARWTSASTLSSGLLIDNGTVAGVNATSSIYTFNVQGSSGVNPFNIASSTGTSLFSVLANGNVGIGTTTPGYSLTVSGDISFTGVLRANGNSGTTGMVLLSQGSSAPTWVATSSLGISGGGSLTGTTGQIAYFSGTDTAVGTSTIFLSGGNVGVGTTTPYAKLTVVGETYADFFTAGSTTATSTLAGGLNVGNGALTYNWATGLTNIANASLGAMTFESDSGMVSWVDMPVTSAAASGTVESYTAQLGGNPMLTVYGLSNGAGAVNTLRLGVGTTTPVSTFAVAGTINASNLVGGASLSADASGNIILTPSDERLKQDITPITSALDKVMKLQGVTFDWKDKERFGSSTEIGFIAQDVQKIVPEVIRQGPEYMSLNYSNMVALVVEAVKELKTKVDAVLGWFSLSGDRINIKGMVCVDDVCVTKDQFKQMLMNSGSVMVIPQTSAPVPTTTTPTTSDTSGSGDSSTSTSDATTSQVSEGEQDIQSEESSSDSISTSDVPPILESTPTPEPTPAPVESPVADTSSTDSASTSDSPAL